MYFYAKSLYMGTSTISGVSIVAASTIKYNNLHSKIELYRFIDELHLVIRFVQ